MVKRVFLLVPVLAVGSTVFGQLPPIPDEPGTNAEGKPRLVVDQRTVDLGKVFEGDIVPVSWKLENRGSADLVIEDAKADCGCTVLKITGEERIIAPGKSLKFRAAFNSLRRRGKQNKSVMIISNDPAEPKLKVRFTAKVETLFEMAPASVINLRNIQRGTPVSRTLDITPGSAGMPVQVVDVQVQHPDLLQAEVEPFKTKDVKAGQRVRFAVSEQASLGTLMTSTTIKLKVGKLERERTLQVRAEVVGELTWQPKVVDATRQPSTPGKRLAPVTVRACDNTSFDLLGANAEPLLEVTFEPEENAAKGTEFVIYMTVRDDAPPGPFGTTLTVRTTSLDQPLIDIPVFGIVAAPITVDPPLVLLRQDGTQAGMERQVKLRTSPRSTLNILEISCPNNMISVEQDEDSSRQHEHIRFLDVRLRGTLPEGRHETAITLRTSIAGAEVMEIPVTIEVPER